MNTPTVECRIPTYRRPRLLYRALQSLVRQSFTNWKAVVIDDSPTEEGRGVVSAIGDFRISYKRNPMQLGAAMNIDHAFSQRPLLEGKYAFVLEDDNAIDPKYIEVGVKRLEHGDVNILSYNQRCIRLNDENVETLGGLLRDNCVENIWKKEDLRLNAFLGLSLPNGGYFWKLDHEDINLSVGSNVIEPQLQECVRQTKITVPIALMEEPYSLWSDLPPNQIRRQLVGNRKLAANLHQLSAAILIKMKPHFIIGLARDGHTITCLNSVHRTLAELSLISQECRNWFTTNPVSAIRCKIRYHMYRDNLGDSLLHLLS